MKEDDLSIRATLAAFPEDDPKNAQRHDLLVEASLAAPPLHPDQATAPSPPPHYLARAKNSLRRARLLDLFIAILALTLFWTQIISPAAQRDIRTVVSLSREQLYGWRDRLPIPEALIYFDPNEAIAEKIKTRIPSTKSLPLSDFITGTPKLKCAEILHERNAEDPAYFASLQRERLNEHSLRYKLPSDFIATADSIDPDNGYFRWLDLTEHIDGAISSYGKGVIDEARYTKSWSQLREALAAPRWQSYRSEILRQCLTGMQEPHDYSDILADIYWLQNRQPDSTSYLRYRSNQVAGLFVIEAQRLKNANNPTGMRALCVEWRTLIHRLFSEHDGESGLSRGLWIIAYSSHAMGSSCETLGLTDEAKFFIQTSDIQTLRYPNWIEFTESPSTVKFLTTHDTVFGTVSPPTPAELRLGRLAEYAMYEGFTLRVATLFSLIILGFITAIRFVAGLDLEQLPARLAGLLTPRDHLVIAAFGLGLPLLYLILHLTVPFLNPRDTTYEAALSIGLFQQCVGFIFAAFSLTTYFTMRHLTLRGQALGFSRIASKSLIVITVFSLATITAASFLTRFDLKITELRDYGYYIGLGFQAFIIAVIIFAIILLCFSTQRKIHIATLLRSLTPCLATFPLVFTLIGAETHHREVDLVSQNTFEKMGPESALGINRIERENSEFLRSAILEFLKTAPSP